MNKQMFVIFSQRLAGWLMLKGFVLQGIQKDKKQSRRNVFLFNNSDELIENIKTYKIGKGGG